ncbi:LCP family protein [Phycicoccus endophyticus]|uniref:LCP family protein n=1 Tax=Phycicoccus endophyticus TaxID=1690220 RepID=A0A7G9R1Y2_9MICO|nr:LCP family protein [Phycicoccus endophyticus]NHI19764.1 hypothetical protein [Phycicoccus endophyticus]QNN49607.1 LCP family protein [Phycicoccus endophyticus]GGL33278.1 hypothetical protein GCM10012283_14640 [Phycicoccus endophyticus]
MRARHLAAALAAAAVALAGCSGDPDPAPSSTSPTPTPSPAITVKGADAALTRAVAKVYAGKTGVTATAHLGTWKRKKVAVVTSGKDVTLAVGPSWKVVGGWWPSLERRASLGKGPRFVLVIGSDARPGEPLKGTRGDTLQIVGIDGKGGGGIIGMARDIWAPMPGGGEAKINAAFAYGGGKGQVETVRAVTGLPIEGYVVTGFGGFQKIVNKSGGLPMKVAEKLVFLGTTTVKKGKQVLSGKSALAYARERKSLPDGDFGRSAHQGDLLLAAAVAARVQGPSVIPKEMTLVSKFAESDRTATEALTFVASMYKVSPGKVGHTVAKGGFGTSSDGQSIVILDDESKQAFVKFKDGRL